MNVRTILITYFYLQLPFSLAANALALDNNTPPFSGTIFLDADIITADDPTTFLDLSYDGRGDRLMFDRRVNAFVTYNAYLFMTHFSDGLFMEIQVNPEFGSPAAAEIQARKYAEVIGRLPYCLRVDVQTVWIHQGVQPFGGGNNNLLIHTGQGELYEADGILEETFVHEACHTSLDATHATAAGWVAAQNADPDFISTYARDNPTREDIAESFLTYLAVKYRSSRISSSLKSTIENTIPNRIAYFESLSLNVAPMVNQVALSGNLTETEYCSNLSITTLGNTTVSAGHSTSIISGTSVELNEGVHFVAGSAVVIKIGSCDGFTVDKATMNLQKINVATKSLFSNIATIEVSPNPFFSEATITLNLPEQQQITLAIYDLTGRLTKQIVNQPMQEGQHIIPLTATSFDAGIYFITLKTNKEKISKKIVIKK